MKSTARTPSRRWFGGRRVAPGIAVGAALIGAIATLTLAGPYLPLPDPAQSDLFYLDPPSARHWLGTDELGRDVMSRVIHGGRASLVVGIGAALVATLVGVPLGLAAGYRGGRVDAAIVQIANLFIALPGLVLALIITAMVGPTLLNLTLVLGFVSWPRMARLVRGQALATREMLFIEAARSFGASASWIIARHLLPNVRRIVVAQFSLTLAYAIITSASLSFLGLGVPPPEPDWGGMVRSGLSYLALAPALCLAPSAAVGLTVLGFYLIGSSAR